MKIALVYQAGIANVFKVNRFSFAPERRNARRVLQADFHSCEMYALGCEHMGAELRVYGCNRAGDIVDATWEADKGPFRDKTRNWQLANAPLESEGEA